MSWSVRQVAAGCLGAPANFSVVRDVLGFVLGMPAGTAISLRRQLELASGPALDINMILVGASLFTAADLDETSSGLQTLRDIYAQVNLGIRKVNWQQISTQDAGGYVVITSGSQACDLTDDFSGPDGALDVFVVRVMQGAGGWSPVGGPCSHAEKDTMTGSVVSLNNIPSDSGNTFAHEIGHYLGLPHCEDDSQCTDPQNFILGGSDSNTGIMTHQGQKMKTHCYVSDKC